jgi:hypothetical protein
VHLTQPLDSTVEWPGTGFGCPQGAPQPESFVLAWETVPRTERYRVQATRYLCDGSHVNENTDLRDLSLEIRQDLAYGAGYLLISVLAFDNAERQLATSPVVSFQDGYGVYGFVFTLAGEGRALHSTGQHVPQIARVEGVGTSYWTSRLTLSNPTSSDLTATLYYTPRGANGLTDFLQTEVTVPAGACRSFPDALQDLFQVDGAGPLEVASTSLVVSSRILTDADGGGSFGQGMLPILDAQVLETATSRSRAGGVMRSGGVRTNLVLNEVWGEPATAEVILLNADGAYLGAIQVTLAPYSNRQINDVVHRVNGIEELVDGQVVVYLLKGPGRIAATMSLVDSSDDPTTIPMIALP